MELNPKASLARLEECLRAYRRPAAYNQDGRLQDLKAALGRAELESANLSRRVAGDPDAQALYRQLSVMSELARGTREGARGGAAVSSSTARRRL
jgi:hypothetical protein